MICLNIFLGAESEEILCKTMGGTACGKYDHLIRIAFNIMTVPIIFSSELKGQKIIRYMSFVAFALASCLIIAHEAHTLKNQSSSQRLHNIRSIGLFHPKSDLKEFSTYYKLAGFISLTMCLFDQNQSILKVKSEMQHPKEFMNMVKASFVVYTLIVFLAGFVSYLAFGQDLQSPLTMNNKSITGPGIEF